jgi:hypothetical protein
VLVLLPISMIRVAAISDARRERELSEWEASNIGVEQRSADRRSRDRSPSSDPQTDLDRAAG